MYNKAQYHVTSNKKLLRKKGKKWITVSVALLGLLGAGTVATGQPIHASARPATARTVHTHKHHARRAHRSVRRTSHHAKRSQSLPTINIPSMKDIANSTYTPKDARDSVEMVNYTKPARKARKPARKARKNKPANALHDRIEKNVKATKRATPKRSKTNSRKTVQHEADQLARASHFSFNSPKERRTDANLVKDGERTGLINKNTLRDNPATIKLDPVNVKGFPAPTAHKATKRASAKSATPKVNFSSVKPSNASKAPSSVSASSAPSKTFNTFNTYNITNASSAPSANPIQNGATNMHQSLVDNSVLQNLNTAPSSASQSTAPNASVAPASASSKASSSVAPSSSAQSQSTAKPSANTNANASAKDTWPGNVYVGGNGVQNNVHSDALFNVPSDVNGHNQVSAIASGTHNVAQRYDTGQRHMTKPGTPAKVTPKILGNPGRYEDMLPVGSNDGAGAVIRNQGDTFAKNDNALNLWVPSQSGNNKWDLAGMPQSNGSYFVTSGYSQYFDYNKPTDPQYSDVYSTRQVPVNNTANVDYNRVYHSTHGHNYGFAPADNGWVNLGSTDIPSGDWKVQDATDPVNYNFNNQTVGKTAQTGKPGTTANLTYADMPAGWTPSANAPKTVTYNRQAVNVPVSPLQKTDTINYMNVSDGKIGTQQMTGNDSRATQAGNNSFTMNTKPSGLNPMYKVVNPGQTFGYDGSTHNVNVGIDTDYIQSQINDAKATHSVAPTSSAKAPAQSASATSASSAPASSSATSTSADMANTLASQADNFTDAINAQNAETQSLESVRNSLEAEVESAGVVTPTTYNVSPNANKRRNRRKSNRKANADQPAYLDIVKPVLVHTNPSSVGTYKYAFGRIMPHHTVRTFSVKRLGRATRFTVHYDHKVGYITGNSRFVRYTYYQKNEVRHHHEVRLLTNNTEYKGVHFTKRNALHRFRAGTTLRIKGVRTIAKGKMTRLQLTNGNWISANKNYVKVV